MGWDPRTWFRSVEPADPDRPLLTGAQLSRITGLRVELADQYAPAISKAARLFDITTPRRIALFVAQLAHESDRFRTFEEYASGRAYEGRADLGNTEPGDGVRFKGHGWIQITGRTNHRRVAERFGIPFERVIPWLMQPTGAALSAAWYWKEHGCNELADVLNVRAITRKINGGQNGIDDRIALSALALEGLAGGADRLVA